MLLATLLDLRPSRRPAPTWVEWTRAATAVVFLLASLMGQPIAVAERYPARHVIGVTTVHVGMNCLSILLAGWRWSLLRRATIGHVGAIHPNHVPREG